jgi:hypothetical protein
MTEVYQFYLTDRFGMPQVAKPKNGKTADLGLAETHNGQDRRFVRRREKD